MMSLEDARKQMMDAAHRSGGTNCPLCGKHVQVYRRKFNSRMALIMMDTFRVFERYPGRYLEIGNYCAKRHGYISGEHAKLVWWGMLKKQHVASERGAKSAGLYRMTTLGFDFVHHRVSVPSHVFEYRSAILKWEGQINIVDALGEGFNYHELMAQNVEKIN